MWRSDAINIKLEDGYILKGYETIETEDGLVLRQPTMDKVLVWFDGKHYYNICAVCGELYPIYKVEDHIIYNLKKKCKCGEKK